MPTISTSPMTPQAAQRAAAREVLPLSLGTAEIREQLSREIRAQSVFSAATTHALYLEALKERIERLLKGGYNNGPAVIRSELKQILRELGYTPELGFPGDEELGIEPAEPGSLQDLSSDARLNLILDTQRALMRGAGQKLRGEQPASRAASPAWELIRVAQRKVPRGSLHSGSAGWERRWVECGGLLTHDGRMIALKGAEIWHHLGDSSIFSDALDVDHAPFAFGSGMGLREVSKREWRDICEENGWEEVTLEDKAQLQPEAETEKPAILPKPVFSAKGMDPGLKAWLKEELKGIPGRVTNSRLVELAGGGVVYRIAQDLLGELERGLEANTYDPSQPRDPDGKWSPAGGLVQGPVGAPHVGKERATASSLGLPNAKDLSASERPERATPDSAMEKLKAGLSVTDPLGRKVVFDERVHGHMLDKIAEGDTERPSYLPQAKEAVHNPVEIWEHDNRHYYVGVYHGSDGKRGMLLVGVRKGEDCNQVVSYQPIKVQRLDGKRWGKLLYTRY